MNILFGIVSLICAYLAFGAGNPPLIPVLGLAFGATGLIRETRGLKRTAIVALCGIALLLSLVGTVLVFARR